MQQIIHYATVFKTLDVFVKQYNSTTPKLSNHLRQPVIATAKEIIKIYSLSLLKANGLERIEPSNIPCLKTNNVQLATKANVSKRTIQRHVKRLLEANVLIEKRWRGSNASYELRFNPEILLINCEQAIKKPVKKLQSQLNPKEKQKTENQFFKKNITTTCPHTDTSNNSYINNLIIGVDNKLNSKEERSCLPLTNLSKTQSATGNTFTGYTERKKLFKNSENSNDKKGKLGAKNISTHKDAEREKQHKRAGNQMQVENLQDDKARASSLNTYIDSLWQLAKNTLYKDRFLTENQEKRAKELLLLWYEPVKQRSLSKVHNVYVDRIELVRKYLKKDSGNRFVQLPNRYFDPQNKTGFAGTKRWYETQAKSKEKTRLKLILHAQIRCFLNNEKKQTADQKPRLTLFRECEARIGKLGKPELLNQFYASILDKSTFKFLKINT